MSWLGDIGKSLGAGLVGGGLGFLVGGPVGALAGFGIGAFSSAAGMSGNTSAGTWGGAAIGGLAGFAIGGPIGAVAGGFLGAMFGRSVAGSFNEQPQQPPYAQQFPPFMPGYGNYGFPGGGMPNFGFPQGNYGFNQFPGMYGPQQQVNIYNYNQCCPCERPDYGPPQRQGGELKQDGQGKPITYTTSGGYQVTVNGHDVSVKDPNGKHTVTHWGDPHENVDGKHLKDWDKKTRTMVLGDGTKITMNANSPNGTINHTSIYDGAQQVQIKNEGNQIEKVGFNPYETQQAERSQADGETAFMGNRRDGSFVYKDIYNQNDDLSIERYHKDIFSEPQAPPPHSWRDDYAFIQA